MRQNWLFFGLFTLAILSVAAKKGLNSSVFDWENVKAKKESSGEVRSFLKSPTRSLKMFEIKAITLYPSKDAQGYSVEKGLNELIIIKEGVAEISINDERRVLGEGSVVVVSEGDDVEITNTQNTNAVYYSFRFKPYQMEGQNKTIKMISPVFIDWNKIEFVTSANGGRRNIMQQQTAMLKELEIHVTTLKEGLPSHNAHVHPDEEIILVRKGFVEETIKGKPYRLGPGSVIFLTNDDLHGISNAGTGQCEYYAIRWLTEMPAK